MLLNVAHDGFGDKGNGLAAGDFRADVAGGDVEGGAGAEIGEELFGPGGGQADGVGAGGAAGAGVDAVVMDLLVANDNIARSGKGHRILEERLAPEEYGVGFRKGDQALRDAVQAQLKAMAADGALKEIAVKWFGADITTVK